MKDMDFRGRWVVVTGASSGLGAEMARQLAKEHGAKLLLVARRKDRLETLATELRSYGEEVDILAADLGSLEEATRVFQTASATHPIYAVILNAGITHFGHYDELSWEKFLNMLDLNVKSTARLLQDFVPYFEARKENGGALIIASLAGLTPVAYQSAYSGTKAFLVHYGCALHHEMKPRGVTVSVFAPGGIATEMTAGERFNDLRTWLVKVEPCAREALMGLKKRHYLTIPGLVYRWGSRLMRLVSQDFLVGRVAAQYRRSLQKNA